MIIATAAALVLACIGVIVGFIVVEVYRRRMRKNELEAVSLPKIAMERLMTEYQQ